MIAKYTGDPHKIVGKEVYHKQGEILVRCIVTNYYFRIRMYTIVPVEDMCFIPDVNADKRRLFQTHTVYASTDTRTA